LGATDEQIAALKQTGAEQISNDLIKFNAGIVTGLLAEMDVDILTKPIWGRLAGKKQETKQATTQIGRLFLHYRLSH